MTAEVVTVALTLCEWIS